MSKEFEEKDFPQLLRFERFLLDHLELPLIAQLSDEFNFVRIDYRYNKIYRLLYCLRKAYLLARGTMNDASIFYKASLLRYAAYTTGFDMRRDTGECPLPSLKYALLSTSLLVDDLRGEL